MRGCTMPLLAIMGLAHQASALQVGLRAPAVPRRLEPAMVATAASSLQADLDANRPLLDSLKSIAPEMDEVALLRFALQFPEKAEAESAVRDTVSWRAGEGKAIVDAAAAAYAKATAVPGTWNNEPVRDAAPNAAAINKFITTKNIVTLSTGEGDLVYVVRASNIEDTALMSQVSVDQLVEFLQYVKEVHSLVANARSARTGRLCKVIFANDISGTRKAPDKEFSKALTASSKSYERLYPTLAGPTLILNLPFILQAFVGLFKPLFPESVRAKLRFEGAPYLAKLGELTPLVTDDSATAAFCKELEVIIG